MPSRGWPLGMQGTPMTGRGVRAAIMPGRWAAPPAPAMMTCAGAQRSQALGGWPIMVLKVRAGAAHLMGPDACRAAWRAQVVCACGVEDSQRSLL